MTSAIVFGPTGSVGGQVARAAVEYGVSKVFLAMRDPAKTISGFDDSNAAYEKVQADLHQPDSVRAAVTKTGAKRAFIYIAHGSSDGMKDTIQALKAGGVEFVVFLSSFGVQGDVRAIGMDEFISYVHAQVEINLEEIFGKDGFVAVRPAWFATNILPYKRAIAAGTVRMYGHDAQFDWITPVDIGNVSGYFLAKGQHTGTSVIYLCGPEQIALGEAGKIVGKNALGKDVTVQPISADDAVKMYQEEHGFPEPMAHNIVRIIGAPSVGYDKLYQEGVDNVQKYSGKEPLKFGDWVSHNKQLFA